MARTRMRGIRASGAERPGQLSIGFGDLLDDAHSTRPLADTTSTILDEGSIDLVLTSPPYCTCIDDSAATRIELAVLQPCGRISDRRSGAPNDRLHPGAGP